MNRVQIVGAGLAGMSAAITLAEENIEVNLFSLQASERAQSVLAEGGINAALDTMGDNDSVSDHYADTMRGGCDLADPVAVKALTEHAPEVVRNLEKLGVPFEKKRGDIVLRYFGGQKKRRTAYVKSSTGKALVTALADECRKYEAKGLIHRYANHSFSKLLMKDNVCFGVVIRNIYDQKEESFFGPVILACGGLNGVFPNWTTGTTQNSGLIAASVFSQGVEMANLEMIQYHPTTIAIPDKRCLISEAARAEGGRLYIEKDKKRSYFMEEKYPELKNLMPRDVVSREMFFEMRKYHQPVYLDMTGISEEVWQKRLPDLRDEIIYYTGKDPKEYPIEVAPGIHYFMGGIKVDADHRSSLKGLYAAGECACQYHGANRLGGNSLLGAIFGGKTAAKTLQCDQKSGKISDNDTCAVNKTVTECDPLDATPDEIRKIADILLQCMGIVRNEEELEEGLAALRELKEDTGNLSIPFMNRIRLAEAMIMSAIERRESRGAHYRSDCTERLDKYQKPATACYVNGEIRISF